MNEVNCKEFVLHGSNLAGVVEILKKNKELEKKKKLIIIYKCKLVYR